MMAIMITALSLGGAALGWKGRLNEDKREGAKEKALHATFLTSASVLALMG